MTNVQQMELEQEEVSARYDILIRTLWLQKHITEKDNILQLKKRSENPSDLGANTMWKHVTALGFEPRHGKSELSLKATL